MRVRERPRILLLVTLAETGGAQRYVAALVPALVGAYDVAVAAHGSGPLHAAVEEAGAEYVPLRHVRRPLSAWRDLLGLFELLALLRRLRPHIVHANSSKAGVLGRVAAWVAGTPIRLFTVHGWAFRAASGRRAAIYRVAERLARRLTTVTICVSEAERTAGLAARACDAHSTVVIRNAIDAGDYLVTSSRTEQPTIVAVGRLQAPKDVVTLVRALSGMQRRPLRAVVVGDGPDRPEIESEIRRLGLTGVVDLAGERDDVTEILAASDVFVLSTRSEGLPMAVLEAMAAGLPVVASRVGGLPELVLDGETGLLVPPGQPAALAVALETLLDDPALRERLGAAGRARVQTHFALEPFRDAHRELYRSELAHRGLPLPSP